MSKYAVNEEGVKALKSKATAITDCAGNIKSAADALRGAADSNSSALGPHQESISSILEEIQAAEHASAEPVEAVSQKLNKVAEKYQAIIDDDPFSQMSGNLGN